MPEVSGRGDSTPANTKHYYSEIKDGSGDMKP